MSLRLSHVLLVVSALVQAGATHNVPLPKMDTDPGPIIMRTQPCWFEPLDEDLPKRLKEKLAIPGIKMLRYNVTFTNYSDTVMTDAGGDLFRPNLWLRTVNSMGTNLLMFDDNFEVYSMGLLGVGIEDMNVELTDSPRGCIHNLTAGQRVIAMRLLLQVDFRVNSTEEKIDELDENICNMRMYVPQEELGSGSPGARFTYVCCHNDHGVMMCADMNENNWVSSLIQILKTIIVLLILCAPRFVPSVYYKSADDERTKYTVSLPADVNVKIERDNGGYFLLKQDDILPLDGMNRAKQTLDTCGGGITTVLQCQVSDITLSIPRDRLLTENSVPVSIPTMLYDNMFHCRVERVAPFTKCCHSSMYGEVFEERFDKYNIKWEDCLKIFVKILVFGVCLIPSIIQYVVYDEYIAPGFRNKELASVRINATYVHKSDFDILGLGNITLHFYAVFIVVITGLLLEIYFHFIRRVVAFPKFSTHFTAMANQRLRPVFRSVIDLALVPLVKCGVLGLFIFPLFLVVVLLYTVHFLIILFPLLNLLSRLFLYPFLPLLVIRRRRFLEYFGIEDFCEVQASDFHKLDMIDSSKKFLAAWYPYMAVGCIFITFLLVWIVDCIIFYTKLLFYTGIGVIANTDKTLPYVTVIILVGIYVGQIFGGISTVYSEYSKTVRNAILSRSDTDCNQFARHMKNNSKTKAFLLRDSKTRKVADLAEIMFCAGADEPVYFISKDLFVFVERTDGSESVIPSSAHSYEKVDSETKESFRVFVPKKFFFDSIELDADGSPGPVWKNVLWAGVRLLIVMAFLGFVVIVVMGLGDTYNISITNQLFLTVAGGLLPLIFRHVVSDTSTTSTALDFDRSDLSLNLVQKLETYSEEWEVVDMNLTLIGVDSEHTVRSRPEVAADVTVKISNGRRNILVEQGNLSVNADIKENTSLDDLV